MAKTSMEIIMSEDLKARLVAVAPKAGKTVQEFAQEALYTFVEDYEDVELVKESRAANETAISLEEYEAKLALEDRSFKDRRKTA